MPSPQWQRDLAALLARVPYVGHGGLSALARDLGVSRDTLYSWHRGRRAPGAENRALLEAKRREG